MKYLSRIGICLAIAAAMAGLGARAADTYPSKTVKLVVGFAPGGATDVIARFVANRLSSRLGSSVIVENRTGAGGTIAANAVAKADPDGYTLAFASTGAFSIAPSIYGKLTYDPVKDFVPVALVAQNTHVLVVNPSVPAKTAAELIAHAKANPGKLSYGSFGNGSTSHLLSEQLRKVGGIEAVHVPYAGSPAMVTATITGDVAFSIDTIQSALPHIRAGKVRALAVVSENRSPIETGIPTFKEGGLEGIDLKNWYGVVAPKGTPEAAIALLAREIDRVVAEPEFREFLAKQGAEAAHASGPAFGKFLEAQRSRWGELAKASGARVD